MVIATADHAHGFDVFSTVDTAIWDALVLGFEENPVSDVEHMCKPIIDNLGRKLTIKREQTTITRVRQRIAQGILQSGHMGSLDTQIKKTRMTTTSQIHGKCGLFRKLV